MAIPLQLLAMLAQLAQQNPDAAASTLASTGQGPPSIAPGQSPFPVPRPGAGGVAGALGGGLNVAGLASSGLAGGGAPASPLQGALAPQGAPLPPPKPAQAGAPDTVGSGGPSPLEALQPPTPGQVSPPPGARTPGLGGKISPDILALLMQALSSQPPQAQSLGQILSQTR